MSYVKKKEGENFSRSSIYRVGIEALSPVNKCIEGDGHVHFSGLNEAITAQAESIFLKNALATLPILKKEKEWLESEKAKNILKDILPSDVNENDVFWVDKAGKGYLATGYRKQVFVLRYICNGIAEDTGMTYEQVFDKFLEAQLTGRLLGLAKLVENSFGKGSFRDLGNMTDDLNVAITTYEVLRKDRQRFLKSKK